jgi:hypothetical protein
MAYQAKRGGSMARPWNVIFRFLGFGILLLAFSTVPLAAQMCPTGTVCVTTWHNDNGRTGQNLGEGTLLYSNLSTSNFGQLCSAALDGQVYSQPLVVTHVPVAQSFAERVVYVVTQNDTLYAIDGTPSAGNTKCAVLASVSLLQFLTPSGQTAMPCGEIGDKNCDTISPTVGILGTPVINVSGSSSTMYVVTETYLEDSHNVKHYYHFLHALDISTMNIVEKTGSPVRICANGCGVQAADAFSQSHIQRPGLLYLTTAQQQGLQNDMVYVAFSMMDATPGAPPNGWVFGYDAMNLQLTTPPPLQFHTSQGSQVGSEGGGIWMGAAGLAWGLDKASGHTYIYVSTANGTWDGSSNWGDSFLKLDPTNLGVSDSFTPSDFAWRDCNDFDIGSGGVMLLPDDEDAQTYFAILGEKESGLWFIDRSNPGKCTPSRGGSCSTSYICANNPTQDCTTMPTNPMVYWTNSSNTACNSNGSGSKENWLIHNTPAFWEKGGSKILNYVYVAPTGTSNNAHPLYQYTLCSGGQNPPVCGTASTPQSDTFPFGATPSVSASAPETASDGIVWVIATGDKVNIANPEATAPGILYAYDALNVATRLYASNSGCPNDAINPATKFSVPTVANGYVYLGTESDNVQTKGQGTFYIFGLNAC